VAVVFADPVVFDQLFQAYGYPAGSVPYQGGSAPTPTGRSFTIGNNHTPGSVANFRGGGRSPLLQRPNAHLRHGAHDRAAAPARAHLGHRARRFEFSPTYEAYGQLVYADYTSTRQLAPTGSGILLVPPTNPYVPADLGTLLASRVNPSVPFRFQRRMSEVGPLQSENDRELLQVTVAARQPAGGWRYDAYAQAGRNEREERQRGNVRVSRLEDLLFAPDGASRSAGASTPSASTPRTPHASIT